MAWKAFVKVRDMLPKSGSREFTGAKLTFDTNSVRVPRTPFWPVTGV
jgi:hypothetical protein